MPRSKYCGNFGATLDIFEASALGNVAELRNLLSDSPGLVNARREHCDGTPLHAARENVEAARLLIEFGANVNAIDGDKQKLMPLHGRAEHGDIEMVKLLLENGADVACDVFHEHSTPLCRWGISARPAGAMAPVAERLLRPERTSTRVPQVTATPTGRRCITPLGEIMPQRFMAS